MIDRIAKSGLGGMIPKNAVEQYQKWKRLEPDFTEVKTRLATIDIKNSFWG